MDHIPLPSHPCNEHWTVPYYVKDNHKYDGMGIGDFLGRIGITLDDKNNLVAEENGHSVQYETGLSAIQSWLFFALLEEASESVGVSTFDREHYILRKPEEDARINTHLLPILIHDIAASCGDWKGSREQPSSVRETKKMHFATILGCTELFGSLVTQWQENEDLFFGYNLNDQQLHDGRLLLLSIVLMLQSLSYAVGLHCISSKIYTLPPGILIDRLAGAGWCPSTIAKMKNRDSGPSLLYFLSFLKPQNPLRHVSCTENTCISATLDKDNYARPHTAECLVELCKDIFSVSSYVCSLLEQGKLPLMYVTDHYGITKITILPHDETAEVSGKFVAISHVWIDGLGNPKENALRSCQALRLQKYVNSLYNTNKPVPFWIDSICVPLASEGRKLAISRMRDVYKLADKVLVLDSLLYDAPSDIDIKEVAFRVYASNWAMRLWTLQECALTTMEQLYFQVANHSYSLLDLILNSLFIDWGMDSVIRPANDGGMNISLEAMKWAHMNQGFGLEYVGLSIRTEVFENLDESHRLHQFIQPLELRSTSHKGDEAICLSSLIDRDPRELLDHPPQERMMVLLSSMKKIPMIVLFQGRDRYEVDGCRWIPRTLLWNGVADPRLGTLVPNIHLDVTSSGLLAKLPGIHMRNGPICNPQDHRGVFFHYNNARFLIFSEDDDSGEWMIKYREQNVAVIFSEAPGTLVVTPECILVLVRREDDEILHTRFERALACGTFMQNLEGSDGTNEMTEPFKIESLTFCIG